MSPEKKVILLFLSLIILIAACVYTHLPQFMKDVNKEAIIATPKIEKVEKQVEEKVVEVSKEEKEVQENTSKEEIENTNDNKIEDKNEEVTTEVEESKVEEEVVEVEKEEPLITTDKRYTRVGTEKNIEELSKTAQELQIKMSEYVKNNPVTFRRASYKLTKRSNKTIKVIVESLKEFPNIKIEVAGHTDASGAAKVNQAISLARAKSVQARLIYYGIDKNRIISRGYGEDIPLVKNSPNGYSKINRRVEFNIVEE